MEGEGEHVGMERVVIRPLPIPVKTGFLIPEDLIEYIGYLFGLFPEHHGLLFLF